MSITGKALFDLYSSLWEAVGIEAPEGQRNFEAAEEPAAANFDYMMDQLHKDLVRIADAMDAQLLPQRFGPEMCSLVGDDAGSFEILTGLDGRAVPVIQLAPGVYRECQIRAQVLKNHAVTTPVPTIVRIIWSSAAAVAKTAVFNVKYRAVADGESLLGALSTVTAEATDSAVSHGRVTTAIELPVFTQGKTLGLRIGHDGAISDMDNAVCIHLIEVI